METAQQLRVVSHGATDLEDGEGPPFRTAREHPGPAGHWNPVLGWGTKAKVHSEDYRVGKETCPKGANRAVGCLQKCDGDRD